MWMVHLTKKDGEDIFINPSQVLGVRASGNGGAVLIMGVVPHPKEWGGTMELTIAVNDDVNTAVVLLDNALEDDKEFERKFQERRQRNEERREAAGLE